MHTSRRRGSPRVSTSLSEEVADSQKTKKKNETEMVPIHPIHLSIYIHPSVKQESRFSLYVRTDAWSRLGTFLNPPEAQFRQAVAVECRQSITTLEFLLKSVVVERRVHHASGAMR